MTDPGVTYRPTVGFPGYFVGDDGSVWSQWHREGLRGPEGGSRRVIDATRPPHRMKTAPHNGYRRVQLVRDGKDKMVFVHRLVLEAFVGPCPPGMEVCHDDNNRANNRRGNLRWDTRGNNGRDKRRHGTTPVGERVSSVKLTTEVVRSLRARYRQGGVSLATLAREYKVHKATVHNAIRGRNWGHLLEPAIPEAACV